MLIASKYEEIYAPEVSDLYVHNLMLNQDLRLKFHKFNAFADLSNDC